MAGDGLLRARARCLAAALACGVVVAGCAAGGASGTQPARSAAPRPAVPILVYHHLATPAKGDPHASLWVEPGRFRAQLRALAAAGFHAVTLDRVQRAWHGSGPPLPARAIVITFDDGFPEQDAVAGPALRARRWPAVLNLQLNRLDVRGGLARAAVRRMIGDGWEIDDHSVTHPDLTRVDDARLRAEVAASRATLRRELGVAADYFCYPYGRADARVRRAVKAAGFRGATTVRAAHATARDDPFALPRIVVRRAWTPAQLVRAATAR
ncbi:MAG TPA: polysaccharide deacetylase family protein [Baekduia sp.]|nr:polysaccharide deacetylase family protein [Baekduia sp.]